MHLDGIYNRVHKKQSHRSVIIISFRTDEILYNLGDLFLSLLWSLDITCWCISNEAYVIPLPETFYFNDVL